MSSASRTNGRAALAVSTLPALDLDLPASGSAWLVCPDCGVWVEAVRGIVQTHKPGGLRCAGSAQRLTFDLTPAQHAARRVAARAEVTRPGASARVRTPLAGFPLAPRRAARRGGALAEQHRAEAAALRGAKQRTAMAAAFEDAWLKVKRVPVAASVHQLAARAAV